MYHSNGPVNATSKPIVEDKLPTLVIEFLNMENVYCSSCLNVYAYIWLHNHNSISLSLFFFYHLFYFWLCWVFVAACGLSLVVASGGYSSLW